MNGFYIVKELKLKEGKKNRMCDRDHMGYKKPRLFIICLFTGSLLTPTSMTELKFGEIQGPVWTQTVKK